MQTPTHKVFGRLGLSSPNRVIHWSLVTNTPIHSAYQAKLIADDLCFNATEAILTNLDFSHEESSLLKRKKMTIKGTKNGSITQKSHIDTNS